MLDQSYRLTSDFIREYNLNLEDESFLKENIKMLVTELEESYINKIAIDDINTDLTKGIQSFTVDGFEEDGEVAFNSFHTKLIDRYGESHANEMLKSFPAEKLFNGLGSNKCNIQIENAHDTLDNEDIVIKYTIIYTSGSRLSSAFESNGLAIKNTCQI